MENKKSENRMYIVEEISHSDRGIELNMIIKGCSRMIEEIKCITGVPSSISLGRIRPVSINNVGVETINHKTGRPFWEWLFKFKPVRKSLWFIYKQVKRIRVIKRS